MRVRKQHAAIAAVTAGACLATLAHAQSSIALFGQIDTGVSYVSNEGGKHNLLMDDGVNGPNLWGIRGTEDLGGGTKAIFSLVNQFHVDDGSFMSGKSLFTRTSYVGLDNDRFGKLTFGNQYDFMSDSLFFSGDDPAELAGHFYDYRAGPFQKLALPGNPTGAFDWDRMSGEAVSNTVKYVSPKFGGFSFGAMYGFGGVAGSVGAGNSQSFALDYAQGPFGIDAAYTNIKTYTSGSPQVSVRNWGIGTHYRFGAWMTNALFTTVHNSANGGSVYEGSIGARYNFAPALSAGASYMYMKGNDVVDNNHAHQFAGILDYALSKRTSVYLLGVYQRANSGASAQLSGMNSTAYASSDASQAVVRVGMHTRF
ncbi:porin [Trinickia caryophylli]|uniref:Outer membrane protein (Porin) n=1 Tax=Trinickia caryophylli TaxID=28094 RepID=A0A1X7CNW3_TRICW|nr:porin [Trinickia caryophylli]PMS11282.1 porin [Trinickia caryophylli]TRX20135.1 porin [Trinickia caryophylli]WQE12514.1 porin [Trinickia caryophylli]SMF00159.1 Outer membrane protein (porin) [Trinickia caryophylli]GLU30198.1 porin [Trinickia caryophylli]